MTGLNVTASAILSAYELRKRRGESNERNEVRSHLPATSGMIRQQPAIFDAPDDFNDELTF
jgi:hypothetical protein